MKPLLPAAAAAGLLLWAGAGWITSRADAENIGAPDARFAGLQWTFARIRYTAWTVPRGGYLNPEDEPWFIDAPAAEQNLSRRVGTATAIHVNQPVVLTLTLMLSISVDLTTEMSTEIERLTESEDDLELD